MLHLQIKRPGEQLGQAASRERDVGPPDPQASIRQNPVLFAIAADAARYNYWIPGNRTMFTASSTRTMVSERRSLAAFTALLVMTISARFRSAARS
jgi:hypothetical protein